MWPSQLFTSYQVNVLCGAMQCQAPTCGVVLNTLAISTTCGHLFCEGCIERRIDESEEFEVLVCPKETCGFEMPMATLDARFIPDNYKPFLNPPLREIEIVQDTSALQAARAQIQREQATNATLQRQLVQAQTKNLAIQRQLEQETAKSLRLGNQLETQKTEGQELQQELEQEKTKTQDVQRQLEQAALRLLNAQMDAELGNSAQAELIKVKGKLDMACNELNYLREETEKEINHLRDSLDDYRGWGGGHSRRVVPDSPVRVKQEPDITERYRPLERTFTNSPSLTVRHASNSRMSSENAGVEIFRVANCASDQPRTALIKTIKTKELEQAQSYRDDNAKSAPATVQVLKPEVALRCSSERLFAEFAQSSLYAMGDLFEHSKVIWKPLQPQLTPVEDFRRIINHKRGLKLKDYHDLHRYSVEDYGFWEDLWAYIGIIYSVPPEKVLTEGRFKEIPIWFPGARLNYAENMLCHDGDAIAVTAARETGHISHYSFRQLRRMVANMAAAMRVHGLQVGDRVAAVVTNHISALVIALAAASIGAMYSGTAPDMGTKGILDRYTQIKPKLYFAETEVFYAGKTTNLLDRVAEVAQTLSTMGLHKVILLPSAKTNKDLSIPGNLKIPNSMTLSAFLATGDDRPLTYEQLPFSHPFFILFSSGTTGPPKCIVHTAGGVFMQGKKDSLLIYQHTRNDTHFQYTTCGWMMWNTMIINISSGTRIICYDGSPFHPDVRTFMRFISDQRVTFFGTSPRWLSEIRGQEINPLEVARFESLRNMFVTGAVLTPPMFEWTQQVFGSIHLISGSGGTDICSGFVSGAPSLPVYAGELQAKCLGMKVQVFDENGKNIEDTGEPGELVCVRPHPSLPLGFWGDDNGEKLRASYFEMFPGIWRQGDFIAKNPKTQGFMFLGRSDGVLNPSGVRMGSGEIYSALESFSSELEDTLCVAQRRPQDKDERVLLFLKMRAPHKFNDELVERIRKAIREARSPRHVPSFIFPIDEIPYTVNGKKIEIAVKQIVSGSTLKPSGTVANPESLQLYYKFRDLEALVDSRGRLKEKAKL
ncbi:hypothetical protein EUX98_g3891 [Antrodiella citrinella]|uniref:RING-type domain-containing protein n=1 Tax=Antrodiella citrinella TaxID=2447956 RepID=A0A4V3XIS8_9APHY|nr:hypothetical protein EUX98_g3891 [Antrodiella citrinella]